MKDKNGYKKSGKMSKREKAFRSILPGSPSGVSVVEGDLRYALQKWKRVVKDSGKMRDVYDNREYKKPSEIRRKIKLNAIYKQQKSLENGDRG